MCVWLLIKAGRAWKLRGSHVLGVGLRYWGAEGYPSSPWEHSCSLQGELSSIWVSSASRCRSYRPSGDSSWQVLRAGPWAFEAAQVGESP